LRRVPVTKSWPRPPCHLQANATMSLDNATFKLKLLEEADTKSKKELMERNARIAVRYASFARCVAILNSYRKMPAFMAVPFV
jgi:hypothetical protein